MTVSMGVWSAQHPNAGWNIHHWPLFNLLFNPEQWLSIEFFSNSKTRSSYSPKFALFYSFILSSAFIRFLSLALALSLFLSKLFLVIVFPPLYHSLLIFLFTLLTHEQPLVFLFFSWPIFSFIFWVRRRIPTLTLSLLHTYKHARTHTHTHAHTHTHTHTHFFSFLKYATPASTLLSHFVSFVTNISV